MKYIISILLLTCSSVALAFSYTQEFTEVELQEKIEEVMPLEKKKFFVTITISGPELDLLDKSDEMSIKANVAASAPGNIKGEGTTTITGSISYNRENGTFHLENPKVVELHVNNVPNKHQSSIKQVAQIAIANAMAKYPLYRLKDDDLKHKLAKSVIESVKIDDGKLKVKLSVF